MSANRLGELVIATHNQGKFLEMRELLAPYAVKTLSAAALGLDEPAEVGADFIANALIKAQAACEKTSLPALADDSGLVIPALGGAPGLNSARFAKECGGFAPAMSRLLAALDAKDAPKPRHAYFICALALVWPDGQSQCFEDRVEGVVVAPRGTKGFGYDAFFLPHGYDLTFGEMDSHEKHSVPEDGSRALSHRARAFQKMAASVFRSTNA